MKPDARHRNSHLCSFHTRHFCSRRIISNQTYETLSHTFDKQQAKLRNDIKVTMHEHHAVPDHEDHRQVTKEFIRNELEDFEEKLIK